MHLSNDEAQFLIHLQKRLKQIQVAIPEPSKYNEYGLTDLDSIRNFVAYMWRAEKNPSKSTYILFYEKRFLLLRLDTYGSGVHTNPDGSTIPPHTPHIHIYDENHGDHQAYLLPELFSDPQNAVQTLLDFFEYTHVVDVDKIQIVEQGSLQYEGQTGMDR